jgi:hypothetical protein
MGSYSTLYINIVFKKETPRYITDFFHKGIQDERVPKPFVDFGFEFNKKVNLTTPEMMLCELGAKTYIDNQPQNHYYLMVLREYELDQFYLTYGLIASLALYAQDNAMAGYIKDEFDGKVDFFAFKNNQTLWTLAHQITTKPDEKLNIFELEALGHKIKFSEGTQAEINQMMETFDKNIPYPNGSNLFFYPENYNARTFDISSYNPSVEEVVRKCLEYKAIEL